MGKMPNEIKTSLLTHFCTGNCDECSYDHDSIETELCMPYLGKDSVALIEELEAQIPKWISVYDFLPAVGQKVITRGQRGGIQAGVFRGSSSNHPETWNWKNRSTLKVYHWIPQSKLPKP